MPGTKGSVRACVIFSLLIAHVLSQATEIASVQQTGFIPVDRNLVIPVSGVILGNTVPGSNPPAINNALPVAELPPQSARTLYYHWDGTTTPARILANPDGSLTLDPRQVNPGLLINFGAAVNAADFSIRLSPPRLEVDPHGCGGLAGAAGACRCVVPIDDDEDYVYPSVGFPITAPVGTTDVLSIDIPVHTYFSHAPIPGQNPYLRTYRKLCIFQDNGIDIQTIDTNIWIAVVHACKDNVLDDTADINDIYTCIDQGESAADAVNNQLTTNGDIDPTDDSLRRSLGAFLTMDGTANFVPIGEADAFIWGESPAMQTSRFQRTVCCGSHDPYAVSLIPNVPERSALGVCIDPAIGSCCGYLPYQPAFDRCCSRTDSEITWLDSQCPCSSDRIVDDCNRQGANLLDNALALGDNRGLLQPVTTNFGCCTASKFPRIDIQGHEVVRTGFCFDATDQSKAACCDDGLLFDPAINQCCPVNGVQTLNLPCPCHVDSDCPENHACCKQIFPPVLPESQGALQCSRFANFPILDVNGGTAPAAAQRCVGACFNIGWQICCNGRVCVDAYERCCNNTCCNKFSSSCVFGQRPGNLNSQFNPLYYHFYFEICSEIEAMTGRRAFLVWILPTMLLFATLTSLALIIIVARRATEHIWELTEKSLVFLAAFTVLLSTSYFFSPIFKYGIVIVFLNLFVIVVAVVRTKSMSTLLLIVLLLGILYVFDPFNGNIYFSLPGAGSEEIEGGAISTSLLESSQRIWRKWDECVGFYDYFRFDDNVRDFRIENPEVPTFGYCSRTWITTLMIFACLIYITTLLILLLAFFHFAKMHTIKPAEVVQLEVVQEPGFYPNQPVAPVFA